MIDRFHSIGFPCERGASRRWTSRRCFHSIGFPCERGVFICRGVYVSDYKFPFNWFPLREGRQGHQGQRPWPATHTNVSIQLVSPARGELQVTSRVWLRVILGFSFHSIGFPCERGDGYDDIVMGNPSSKFPFNWFPLREGRLVYICQNVDDYNSFHSIGFPCERGDGFVSRI